MNDTNTELIDKLDACTDRILLAGTSRDAYLDLHNVLSRSNKDLSCREYMLGLRPFSVMMDGMVTERYGITKQYRLRISKFCLTDIQEKKIISITNYFRKPIFAELYDVYDFENAEYEIIKEVPLTK